MKKEIIDKKEKVKKIKKVISREEETMMIKKEEEEDRKKVNTIGLEKTLPLKLLFLKNQQKERSYNNLLRNN